MTAPLLALAPDAEGVVVDLGQLVETRLLLQANSGGGKSWAIRYLLEQTYGRVQHIVIDREGEFATLREHFDYLLVGPDGELAADVRSAGLLARKLLELGVSAVIDLSGMRVELQREYVAAFIDAMNHLPRELWRDCMVLIDEAQIFAPQKLRQGDKGSAASLAALGTAAVTWRKRGFGLACATPNIARIDKDLSDGLLNKLIGRTSEDSRRRAADELGMSAEASRALRSLKPGTFWAYGPAISDEPVLVRTGEVRTRAPKRGAAREPAPPTPAAIRDIAAALAELPKEAEEEARTADDLRRRVKQLEAELYEAVSAAGAGVPAVDTDALRRELEAQVRQEIEAAVEKTIREAEERAVRENDDQWRERWQLEVGDLLGGIRAKIDAAHRALMQDLDTIEPPGPRAPRAVPPAVDAKEPAWSEPTVFARPETGRSAYEAAVATAPAREAKPAEGVSGPQQRMLNWLATLARVGWEPADRSAVAVLSDQSPTSSGFEKNMSTLRSAGLVEYPDGDSLRLTPAGRRLARPIADALTLAGYHSAWQAKLSGPQWAMCRELARIYPRPMTRDALAERTGQSRTSSGFEKNLSTLRTRGLVAYPNGAEAVATDKLVPKALRS